MRDGQQVRFACEGDQSPGMEASDIVVVLDEKEHNFYARKGNRIKFHKKYHNTSINLLIN